MRHTLLFALFIGLITGCVEIVGSGGGTGGGGAGGGGAQGFAKGFVFVRADDRNVYVADQRDYTSPFAVTSLGGARTPSLSHDGKTIVFVRTAGTDSAILTVPVAGGAESTVLIASATPGVANVRTPVFTPDGLHIVFSFDDAAESSVGGVDVTGASFVRIAGGSALSYSGASVYPDGSALLAAAGPNTEQLTQLVRIDLATVAVTPVTDTLGLDALNLLGRVVVSPDGTKATFDARVSSGSARIFVVDLATRVVNQVTDYPGAPGANDASPCWVGADSVCFSSDTGGADATYALAANALRTSGALQVAAALDPWYGPN